jgi:hypothetical protein
MTDNPFTDNPLLKFLASLLVCSLSAIAAMSCDPPIRYLFGVLWIASGVFALYVMARLTFDY